MASLGSRGRDLFAAVLGVEDTTVGSDEGAEHEGGDGGELDEDVDGGAGGVLKRVTDGVTDDSSLVLGVALNNVDGVAFLVMTTDELLGLNELLGVVPGTARVGGGEGDLDTGDNSSSEETRGELVAEEVSTDERGDNDDGARGDHLSEGGVGGDSDALLVIGLGVTGKDSGGLSVDLSNHILSSFTDSGHGKSGESVGEHSTEEETSEGEGLEDVNLVGISVASLSNTGNEGTEESEGNEAGRADGEALADSSGGVSSSVESVSDLTDALVKVGHLSDTASVVRDGSISVDGEGNGEAAEHTNGSEGNSVHGSPVEGEEDGDGEADNRDDVGEVSKSKTLDDVGGSVELAGLGELLSGSVGVGGVVLSGDSNDETGPETEGDAAEDFPSGGIVAGASEGEVDVLGEDVEARDEEHGHEEGGNNKLNLKLVLNGHLDSGEGDGDERGTNSDGGHNKREVDGIRGLEESRGGSRHDESGAGGLSEGSEKIGAHTSDVTNVVTDVVSNSSGVQGRVFGEGVSNLTSEVSTDISSLGVDTTTDSSEKSDGGATETVARDELEELTDLSLDLREVSRLGRDNGRLEGEDEDLKDQEGKTDEGEAEDLTALEGNHEALFLRRVAKEGGLDVGGGGDFHANETGKHGGDGANEEREGGVGEGERSLSPGHVDSAEQKDAEQEAEKSEVGVLLSEESDGALEKETRNVSFKLKLNALNGRRERGDFKILTSATYLLIYLI